MSTKIKNWFWLLVLIALALLALKQGIKNDDAANTFIPGFHEVHLNF